jgi:FKBP-type peptidyl-prolyl cis-trans isomerase FkpA
MDGRIMKLSVLCFAVSVFTVLVGVNVVNAKPLTQKEKDLYYTFGVKMSTELAPYGLSKAALEEIFTGLRDGHADALRLNPTLYEQDLRQHLEGLVKSRVSSEEAKGSAFLTVFKKREGVLVTAKGAAYRVTRQGTGPQPSAASIVQVHYEGRTVEGLVFDSSKGPDVEAGAPPVSFPLDRVIACWTDVLPKLTIGSKAQIVCPARLAYGARGAPPIIPPGATLVFEIELLGITRR